MRNKNTHSITFKKKLSKCEGVFRAYSELQFKYGDLLEANKDVVQIRANVLLKDLTLTGSFTSDFVCLKADGELMVRECVGRKSLMKPSTIRMLDASLEYWTGRGVSDWGIVLDE